MIKRVLFTKALILCVLTSACYAGELKAIELPAPNTEGGKPLMEVLKERRSVRDFSPRELPLQVLSDMLWAGAGINRPESGLLTAPTAMNMQEIDIYVANKDGLYIYDPSGNILKPVLAGDIREATGKQPFVGDAPINLVFVADLAKMKRLSIEEAEFYAATDTGYISQNIYLYCASAGLVTVVRGWLDRPALAKAMKLKDSQKIILAQTVGYPVE